MGSKSLSFLLSKASKIDHKYLLMRSKKIFKNKGGNVVLKSGKLPKKLDMSKKSRKYKKTKVSRKPKKSRISKKSRLSKNYKLKRL